MAIVKRKRGGLTVHLVCVRDSDGEWFERRSFTTRIEAREYEAECVRSKSRGGKAVTRAVKGLTFDAYWNQWKDLARQKVSAGWKISQDQMYRDHLKPVLGDLLLIEISKVDVLKVMAKAKEKGLGEQMVLHLFRQMHKMMSDAVELFEYRDSNPVLKKLKPETPKTFRRYLEPPAARAFLEKIRGDFLAPGVWVMTYNALRIGELQALRWKAVDLKSGIITLEEQWSTKEKRFKGLKNNKPVRLPMPPALIEYLSGIRPLDVDPAAFVCPAKGGGMLAYDTMEGGLKRLCRLAGVTELSPHELRHTSTEIWTQSGASKEDIRRLLNHTSDAAVDGYMHETAERLTRIAQSMPGSAPRKGLSLVTS